MELVSTVISSRSAIRVSASITVELASAKSVACMGMMDATICAIFFFSSTFVLLLCVYPNLSNIFSTFSTAPPWVRVIRPSSSSLSKSRRMVSSVTSNLWLSSVTFTFFSLLTIPLRWSSLSFNTIVIHTFHYEYPAASTALHEFLQRCTRISRMPDTINTY